MFRRAFFNRETDFSQCFDITAYGLGADPDAISQEVDVALTSHAQARVSECNVPSSAIQQSATHFRAMLLSSFSVIFSLAT